MARPNSGPTKHVRYACEPKYRESERQERSRRPIVRAGDAALGALRRQSAGLIPSQRVVELGTMVESDGLARAQGALPKPFITSAMVR